MPKEWILNSAANRFQYNFKRNVGAVAEAIRDCSPKTLEDWEEYYYKNIRSKDHLVELGKKLYIKITEVLVAEIESITEQNCIDYMINLVINRTYDGYTTEIDTIYGQLRTILDVDINPAPDEWDRLYNVDFYIQVNNKYIGLQIKPVSDVSHITQIYKEQKIQAKSHTDFESKFGGKVFYIFSIKRGKIKEIHNTDVISEIQSELKRLQASQ